MQQQAEAPETMAEIKSPHDSFFKRLFGNLEIAADFLRNYLPSEILVHLDLSTLTLEKESFVDPSLRESFSDLLFRVQTTTGEAVFIYLLLEHKSAPEKWVAFQLLRYIVQFWERMQAQGSERLPLIVPIVFYHGQERWTVGRRLSALIELRGTNELQKYAPEFEYDLRDLSPSGGAEIKGQPRLRAGLQMLRYIFSEELSRRLPEVFRHLREMPRGDALEYARSLLAYLSSAGRKVKKEVVKTAMQETFGTNEIEFDKSALFIQEWMAEGREEGREEGLHTGLYSLTLRLLQRVLGPLNEITQTQIQALPNDKLEALGEALLDFTTLEDLQTWLTQNAPVPPVM
jgi:predicted transposase YdaD